MLVVIEKPENVNDMIVKVRVVFEYEKPALFGKYTFLID
jgi:hypothetical protein